MPTPTKPYKVIAGEKKSHRTKKELAQRKQGEKDISSSEKLKERREIKSNKIAHKEFIRVQKLLQKIDKNDALYEPVINRYCMIQAECTELEERKQLIYGLIAEIKEQLERVKKEHKENLSQYIAEIGDISKNLAVLAGQLGACDKILQQKRKMLLDIERENIMTIAAALRAIPKTPEQKSNPLLEALKG